MVGTFFNGMESQGCSVTLQHHVAVIFVHRILQWFQCGWDPPISRQRVTDEPRVGMRVNVRDWAKAVKSGLVLIR